MSQESRKKEKVERVVPNALPGARRIGLGTSRSTFRLFVICLYERTND
jgi:hypothetical protein